MKRTVLPLTRPFALAASTEVRKTLESRRNELESAETRAKSLQQDVRDIADQREKLNQRLLETAALIQKSEARLSAIEARIGELEAQEKLLQGSLAQLIDAVRRLKQAHAETPAFRSSPAVYYRVASVDDAHAALVAAGAEILSPPHLVHATDAIQTWMCFTKDPDGNAVALMEERPIG